MRRESLKREGSVAGRYFASQLRFPLRLFWLCYKSIRSGSGEFVSPDGKYLEGCVRYDGTEGQASVVGSIQNATQWDATRQMIKRIELYFAWTKLGLKEANLG